MQMGLGTFGIHQEIYQNLTVYNVMVRPTAYACIGWPQIFRVTWLEVLLILTLVVILVLFYNIKCLILLE
jgi:hypothetical protein